jgi:N-methylhydantoinase A
MKAFLGIDVGGTFTDFIEVDASGGANIVKVPSTPDRPAEGVLAGIRKLARSHSSLAAYLGSVELIVHGTTITTNAVITRRYAKTGFLTTKGLRDLLNSRRGIKRNAFTAKEAPPEPIVPQYLVRTVEERIDRAGSVIQPLNEDDVRAAAAIFRAEGVQAIAVCYMFSFVNPAHEERTRKILEQELPDCYVSLSSRVLPQVRMYERGSTTTFNASVGPLLRSYIDDLLRQLSDAGFRGRFLTMQSNGGVMSPEVVKDFAANTLLSGPASGPVAGAYFARPHGLHNLITIDMGGTSLDACLVQDGRASITNRSEVAEYALAVPSLDINAIGAGGGSIATVSEAGILRVGPESAGAAPGPAAYGQGGTMPTVTDANLLLGYLNADYFLGGEKRLDPRLAESAVEQHVARPLGLDARQTALGIVRLVDSQMANAVRAVSITRGFDPREACLVAGGGAGPLHACGIAEELDMDLILVPTSSSVLCAAGMLMTTLRQDFVRYASIRLDDPRRAAEQLNEHRAALLARGAGVLDEQGVPEAKRRLEFSCDMQFEGQFNVLETRIALFDRGPVTEADIDSIRRLFHEHHDRVYGYVLDRVTEEIQSIRLTAIGLTQEPPMRGIGRGGSDPAAARKSVRKVWFDASPSEAAVYEGERLKSGNEITGPALIERPTATTKVAPGWRARVDDIGSLLLWRGDGSLETLLKRLTAGAIS